MTPLRHIPLAAAMLAATATASAHAAGPAASQPAPRPDPLAVETALRQLHAESWVLQAEALRLLVRWRAAHAADAVRQLIASPASPWVRGRALVALAELLGPAAHADVTAHAAAETPALRAAAVEAMGVLGEARYLPAVRKALADPSPAVRSAAVVAFARLAGAAAGDVVFRHLADPDRAVVRHATAALAHVGTDAAARRLTALLDHADATVRAAAARVLRDVRPPAATGALLARMAGDADEAVRLACEKALVAYDPAVVAPPMLAALRAGKPEHHPAALKVLAARLTDDAAAELAEIYARPADRYTPTAGAALRILASADPQPHRAVFVRYLSHPAVDARAAAAAGLWACASAGPFPLLRPLLVDASATVRAAACAALGRATTGAPPGGMLAYLDAGLRSADPNVIAGALRLLPGRLTRAELPQALGVLGPVLGGGDADLRRLAAESLAPAADERLRTAIAAAQGFVARWRVLGPYPPIEKFATRFPPDYEVNFARTYEAYVPDREADARLSSVTLDGKRRRAVVLRAPSDKSVFRATIATYFLDLPDKPGLRLAFAAALTRRTQSADGLYLEVRLGGKKVHEISLARTTTPEKADVDLSAWRGKRVMLELVLDALDEAGRDEVAVVGPRVLAGSEELLDVTDLGAGLPARVSFGDKQLPPMKWRLLETGAADGTLDLAAAFGGEAHGTAYAVADLAATDATDVRMSVHTNLDFALRLNGRELTGKQVYNYWHMGEHRVIDARLPAGTGRLFLKVRAGKKGFFLRLRLTGRDDRALPAVRNVTR